MHRFPKSTVTGKWVAAIERIWHTQDSQGQILALDLRFKSLKPVKLLLSRSAAERMVTGYEPLEGMVTLKRVGATLAPVQV